MDGDDCLDCNRRVCAVKGDWHNKIIAEGLGHIRAIHAREHVSFLLSLNGTRQRQGHPKVATRFYGKVTTRFQTGQLIKITKNNGLDYKHIARARYSERTLEQRYVADTDAREVLRKL